MKKTHSFRFLWLGQSLANFADSLYILAIVSLVYTITHSAVLSSLIPVIRTGSVILGSLVAPVLMERIRLARLLWLSQSGQTLVLLCLIVTNADGRQIPISLWLFIAVISFLDGWANPVRNALVPRLVDKEQLMKANSLLSTSDQVVLLAGWSMGGVLAAKLGSLAVLWITFFVFAISTLSILFIHDPIREPESNHSPSIWKAVGVGWKYLISQQSLRRITLISILEYSAGTVWAGAILLAFVEEVLHTDQSWWGWINASYFAGSILGGFLVMKFTDFFKERLVFGLLSGSAGMAVITFAFATIPIPLVSLILSLLLGLPYQIRMISERTLIQTQTSENVTGKIFASHYALTSAVFSISVLLMGWIAETISAKSVYWIASVFCALSAILTMGLKSSSYREKPDYHHHTKFHYEDANQK